MTQTAPDEDYEAMAEALAEHWSRTPDRWKNFPSFVQDKIKEGATNDIAFLKPFIKAAADAAVAEERRRAEASNARLRGALKDIACFDDKRAQEHLEATGSYGGFDEPGSVHIARAALTEDQQDIENTTEPKENRDRPVMNEGEGE